MRARTILAGATLAVLTLSPPAQGQPIVPRSGLPWPSGVVVTQPGFEAWRGRPIDTRVVYFNRSSWAALARNAAQSMRWATPLTLDPSRPRLVLGLAMLPNDRRGQLDACAAGTFDGAIQRVVDAVMLNGGQRLADAGRPAVVRLGWEANLPRAHPWVATGDGTSYAACWRRWSARLNPPGRKRVLLDWNMSEQGTPARPVENLWPGGEHVDFAGINTYNRCPAVVEGDEAAWLRRVNRRDRAGNPAGIQVWFDWVRARGKPFAVGEWGVHGPDRVCRDQGPLGPGGDTPWWVGKMHGFFRANAAAIAHESYFNGHGLTNGDNGSHAIFRPDPAYPSPQAPGYLDYVQRHNPRSAARYRELWGPAPPARR